MRAAAYVTTDFKPAGCRHLNVDDNAVRVQLIEGIDGCQSVRNRMHSKAGAGKRTGCEQTDGGIVVGQQNEWFGSCVAHFRYARGAPAVAPRADIRCEYRHFGGELQRAEGRNATTVAAQDAPLSDQRATGERSVNSLTLQRGYAFCISGPFARCKSKAASHAIAATTTQNESMGIQLSIGAKLMNCRQTAESAI